MTSALARHLECQLGQWPPTGELTVVASERRTVPGWDGKVRPFAALATPLGTVLSVAPERLRAVEALAASWGTAAFDQGLAEALGTSEARRIDLTALFRWREPADIGEMAAGESDAGAADTGEWVEVEDPRVPPWLRPFNGGVLCAWGDDGEYIGGVGVKRHDAFGQEIAVGTEPAARGRGLARRLVATAAREIARRGAVATYVHEPVNLASARVADAAGFPDRGWRLGGFWVPRNP